MDKKKMSEADIRSKFITPAVLGAGWDLQTQMREEFTLTKGRIVVSGQLHTRDLGKHKAQRADYVLFYKPNIPIAVIEAKDNKHSVGGGMQQALGYAHTLDVPFVFSSNGDAFLFRNNLKSEGVLEKEIKLEDFPSPQQLWAWWMAAKGLTTQQAELVTQDYYGGGTGKTPRYYQLLAINKTTEAIAKGQNRILLVMATGTGKTFTAFQIIWRLWRARAKKRILFLADRNILVDQTMTNDFKPFGAAMTKISKGQINTSYEIYLSLYQAVTGTEEAQDIYKEFSPDFFDLIVVDECHRGSAAEDSNWRRILEYFSAATQIGLTATPKETKEVSNSDYFGHPLYTYSLRQGIEDGFLAPYKVVRIHLDSDLAGWTPQPGQLDKYGHPIEQRVYNERDFDRTLVLEERTKLVARKVSEYLKATSRYDKTIVFCEDIDHAERMRQALVNENTDLVAESDRYVVRITGDSKEGKAELDNFIFPESRYPAIATTSKLMSTGVDAQTCKVIVLDKRIESMTEFKQIIGRGTRVKEEYGKYFFTILDFKGATAKFADPEFDGDPVQVYVPGEGASLVPPVEPGLIPDDGEPDWDSGLDDGDTTPVRKYYVAGGEVRVIGEQVMYYNAENQPVTESLMAYTRRTLGGEFASLDDFLKRWNAAERKGVILEELEKQGIIFEALSDQVSSQGGGQVGSQLDPFDLICHLVWGQPPLTRHERAANVKKRDVFTKYGPQARQVLEALLDKYADQGVEPLEQVQILKIDPFRQFGTPLEIVRGFGGKPAYEQAIRDLETELYTAS